MVAQVEKRMLSSLMMNSNPAIQMVKEKNQPTPESCVHMQINTDRANLLELMSQFGLQNTCLVFLSFKRLHLYLNVFKCL